jgi:coenzyme F420-0:L-glutamate ligase / coenzyme F420-1:gamma-L-glutamate ligase
MSIDTITITGLRGMPEVKQGDDLSSMIASATADAKLVVQERDIFVIAQKIVSKAEGRVVQLDSIVPSTGALEWAARYDKDPRVIEVVLRESKRVVRMDRGVIISETHHGFVCANAGVDASNTPEGTVVLLPEDPDGAARHIRQRLEGSFGVRVAVIVSDTFGRPWREGLVNVALGVSGMAPLIDYRGQIDSFGRGLRVTVLAVADELASAAELVMRKTDAVPVAIIRGFQYDAREASGRELIRASEHDLFR